MKHGLDLGGTIGGSLIWEAPIRIFHSSHVVEAEIGSYSYVSPRTEIHHATIGRYCSIGDNVSLRGSAHPKEWLSSHPFPYTNLYPDTRKYEPPLTFEGYGRRTHVGHDVWIGSRAIVLPGVTIGTGAIIGAGAVVTKDVPAYAVAAGNPARVVKHRFDAPLIERLLQSEWWNYDLPRYLEQHQDVPLDNPERMLDFLARNGSDIPRIEAKRKSYLREKNKIVIRTIQAPGT
ncbi:acetyltransferase-like isoleucine patch superfamily enzyme [Microvirga flocculans]|uniref:Acetyltransferase-like isoleucine patch superfamily enzyme n=1 Tax=Microvirga flocculans TaxID=217168 RepID=A0A7W6II94_9HYPH|nr:CatB-related O-acetyltransferase [Microvirga flocculans]MBB4041948.1 acetyltransferase-like isoleucine patch superfamily enzyme [Microvirga flocculans]